MGFLVLTLIVLAVLGICVTGMAVGVMNGRKPIRHCGGAALDAEGNPGKCALCGNTTCKNQGKNAA
jgi:hypothetical protein